MKDTLAGLVNLLLPPRCSGCGAQVHSAPTTPLASALCPTCISRLPLLALDGSVCCLCQSERAGALVPPDTNRCDACRLSSPLAGCWARVSFTGDVEDWISAFKYPPSGLMRDPGPGRIVSALVEDAASRIAPTPCAVAPIPLHPRRLRERGFNPAMTLAREAARATGARLHGRLLARVRETPSQTGLDRRARRHNVAGAFRCRTPRRIPEVVWLVDDVVTTGSTLAEAARALRRAGARRVYALCAARTPLARDPH